MAVTRESKPNAQPARSRTPAQLSYSTDRRPPRSELATRHTREERAARLTQPRRASKSASQTQPDPPSPQSQSLSRSYGSNLPTSLTYIVLLTRGCSPWRPAADIGTDQRENFEISPGFSRADDSAPDTAGGAVLYRHRPPYLELNSFHGDSVPLQRKENSSQGCRQRLLVRLRYRILPPPTPRERRRTTTYFHVWVREY